VFDATELTSEIRTVVREFILSEFLAGEDASKLSDDTPLITGGVLDSVAIIRLVTHFEERFNIVFDTQEVTFENFDTVDRMVEVVGDKVRNATTGKDE
jgi:acyl carrier protein